MAARCTVDVRRNVCNGFAETGGGRVVRVGGCCCYKMVSSMMEAGQWGWRGVE